MLHIKKNAEARNKDIVRDAMLQHMLKWMHHFHALGIDFGNKDRIFIGVK